MMNARKSVSLLWLPLPLAIALFATGCKQDAPAETAAAPAAEESAVEAAPPADATKDSASVEAAQPAPHTDAVVIEDRSTPTYANPSFDAKAFEGSYTDGTTTLSVTQDGTFSLEADGNRIEGTWTAEADGKTVLLDPGSKGEQDRKVEVVSGDNVRIVGGASLQRKSP